MKFANLHTFAVLARLRHFGRTADKLHTTQPAISTRISVLERQLGVRLIEREGRHFQLTPAGEQALPVIERLIADFEALKLGFADPAEVDAKFRIGVIDAVVQTWLPHFYDRLRRAYPQAQVEIIVDSTVNLLQALEAGQLDLACCLDPVAAEGHRSFHVCTYAMAWIGSPGLVEAQHSYTVAELAAMPLITFQRDTPPYRMIAPYFHDEREGAAAVANRALAAQLSNSNSLPTMIRLAIDGLGIAAVPALVVRREVAAGDLAMLKVEKPFPPLPLTASYRAGPDAMLIQRVAELTREAVQEFCQTADGGQIWL